MFRQLREHNRPPATPVDEAISVPRIMAAVMSWRDAKPLLEQMDGPEAPKDWQGGLPITYRLGGGRVKVHLKVDMDNSVKPNYVVEAWFGVIGPKGMTVGQIAYWEGVLRNSPGSALMLGVVVTSFVFAAACWYLASTVAARTPLK